MALTVLVSDPGPVLLRGRQPMAVHLGGAAMTEAHRAALLSALGPVVDANTRLRVAVVETLLGATDGSQRCAQQSSFRCWVDLLGGDSNEVAPLLFLANGIALEGDRLRIAAFLVDLGAARSLLDGRIGDEVEALEAQLFARAITSSVRAVRIGDPGALRKELEALLTEELGPRLESAGCAYPNGRLIVEADRPNWQVEVEGLPVGLSNNEVMVIDGVREGQRAISVQPTTGGGSVWTQDVAITRGAEVHVRPVLGLEAPTDAGQAVFWSGVGAVGLGLGILAYSLLATPQATELDVCVVCDGGASRRFARTSDFWSKDGPPGGPLVAPLGYSVAAAGATTSLASLLGPPEDFPWWAIVAGIAVGAASYGVSEALD